MRSILAAAALFATGTAVAAPLVGTTVDDALARPGLVVVEVTAEGHCPNGGWADPSMPSWLAEHGITAVSVPRDTVSVGKLVPQGIRAAEMRFAFQDGAPLDRVCGCMDADALKGWLGHVAAGRTAASALRAEIEGVEGDDWPLDRWLELVQLDYCAHRLDDAFATALYLWDTIPDAAPHRRAVRFGRVSHDLGVLARKHPAAEEGLRARRDALAPSKSTDMTALDDWVALNRILLEDDQTLAWFDASRDDPAQAALIDHQAPNVFYLLAEDGRWAEAGAVVGELDVWLNLWKAHQGGLESATWGYAALAAASRHREGAKLAKSILKAAPEAACGLLAKVTEVGAVHGSQKGVAKRCDDVAVVDAWSAVP